MQLIPPTDLPKPDVRARMKAAVIGGCVGVVIAALAWFATDEVFWLYAVPIGALVGIWVRGLRPNVLWWRHG